MSAIQKISELEFQQAVLTSDQPVLVDFYAEWCGPCRTQARVLEEFLEGHEGAKVVKVDVDESQNLAYQYQINAMPTLLVFRQGQVVARKIGIANERELVRMLAS